MPVNALELKIPPGLVLLAFLGGMWGLAEFTPGFHLPDAFRRAATLACLLGGAGFAFAAVFSFQRKGTTVNPLEPEKASNLVTSGVFNITRNPMYLGLALFLLAAVFKFSNAYTLAGPIGFVLYMNAWQIDPEEHALEERFGQDYLDYKERVRRWL
ncbi:MAG: isoprenylcysteine carboxylmethyltransferase family protein [Balneolaceae bacterium]|nr:isoprenylcysteine carboxylmethyltransferase family protein [Balneolaceae bacterium]